MSVQEEKEIAIQAMNRAAIIARERAARHGLKIGIWRSGKIELVDPLADLPSGSLKDSDQTSKVADQEN